MPSLHSMMAHRNPFCPSGRMFRCFPHPVSTLLQGASAYTHIIHGKRRPTMRISGWLFLAQQIFTVLVLLATAARSLRIRLPAVRLMVTAAL